MTTTKRKILFSLFAVVFVLLVCVNFYSAKTGTGRAANIIWDKKTIQPIADELAEPCKTEYDKANAFACYIKYNFRYKEQHKRYQFPEVRKMVETKEGVCYDFSAFMASLCREKGIPCYVVSGEMNSGVHHSWNVVKIDNRLYFLDITNSSPDTSNWFYPIQDIKDIPDFLDCKKITEIT